CYQPLLGYAPVPHRYGPVPGDPSPISPTHRKSPMSTSGHRASDHLGHPQKDRGQMTENSAPFGRLEEGRPLPRSEGEMTKARVLGIPQVHVAATLSHLHTRSEEHTSELQSRFDL